MIKLFNRDETNFEHNETILRNVISTSVEEESNGLYELVLEHPRDEIGNQLTNGKIIKAPTPRGDQLFRIYKPIKNLKTYTIYARHIFYDLLNNFIESAKPTNADGNAAIQRILDRLQFSQRFIGSSDIADYSEAYYVRMNPVQALIGADNSFINVWGGELIRDNFTFRINVRGGFDTGYEIRTGKNLTGAEIELDESGVYTRIYPSVVIEDNVVTTLPEEYIDSPLILNYESPRIIEERIELTDEQKELPLSEIYNLMRNHCSDLFEKGLDKPSVNYKVDFVELRKTAQYAEFEILETVNLYDDVRIYIKELNIDIVARVIKIEYDSLKEQYNKIELGNFKNSLSSQLGKVDVVAKQINNELDRIENIAQLAANGKNTIFRGPDEPTIAIKNDLWYKPIGDGEIELYIYDGNSWGEDPVISSGINDEISQAIAIQQAALEEVKTTADYSYDQIQQTIDNSGFTNLDTAFANVQTLSEQAESNADEAMQLAIGSDGRLTLAEQFLDGFRNTAFDPTTGQLTLTEQTINGLQNTVSDPVNGLETRVTTIADGFQVLSNDVDGLEAQLAVTNENVLARVEKGDVYSQLLIDSRNILFDANDRIMLSADKVVIDASEGTFISGAVIENASIDSAKISQIDGNVANIININADEIVSGNITGININGSKITNSFDIEVGGDGTTSVRMIGNTVIEGTIRTTANITDGGTLTSYIDPAAMGAIINNSNGSIRSQYHLDSSGLTLQNGSVKTYVGDGGFRLSSDDNPVGGTLQYSSAAARIKLSSWNGVEFGSLDLGYYRGIMAVTGYPAIDMFAKLNMQNNHIENIRHLKLARKSGNSGSIIFSSNVNHLWMGGRWGTHIGAMGQDGATVYEKMYFNWSGSIIAHENINMNGFSVTNQSDRRLKKNIEDHTDSSLEIIKKLRFVNFEYKDHVKAKKGVHFGLIAQEAGVLGLHLTENGQDSWELDYSGQTMHNSKAIQELVIAHEKVVTLASKAYLKAESNEERIEKLEAELKLLKGERE